MSAIHRMSSIVPLEELNLFEVSATQTSIEQNICTEHRPTSALNPTSYIQFNFTSGYDEYIRTNKSWIYLKLRINIETPMKVPVVNQQRCKGIIFNFWLMV